MLQSVPYPIIKSQDCRVVIMSHVMSSKSLESFGASDATGNLKPREAPLRRFLSCVSLCDRVMWVMTAFRSLL